MAEREIADREGEFEFFQALLDRQPRERIILVEGHSRSGKTELLREMADFADTYLGQGRCARFDLKGSPTLDEMFFQLAGGFGSQRCTRFREACNVAEVLIDVDFSNARFGSNNETNVRPVIQTTGGSDGVVKRGAALLDDLAARDETLLIVLDTHEKASEETKSWIVTQLLPTIRRAPRIVTVIGGQNVPDPNSFVWGGIARLFVLGEIRDPDMWLRFARRRYPHFPRERLVMLCEGLGDPAAIRVYIDNVGRAYYAAA
jgi:hypothetical protein